MKDQVTRRDKVGTLERIKGQVLAERMLRGVLKTNRIAPAYLFSGPEGTGKVLAALQFAKALNCEKGGCEECPSCVRIDEGTHPDVKVISVQPDKSSIGIEQVRGMQKEAYLKPFMSRAKVYIIENAERMTEEASNSLLKILEEPPGQAFFILTTSSPRMLIPTITSRCQAVRFVASAGPYSEKLLKKINAVLPPLESSSIRPLLNFSQKVKGRDEVLQVVDAISAWYRDVLLLKEGAEEIFYKGEAQRLHKCGQNLSAGSLIYVLQQVLRARYNLARTVSPRLVLESLMLELVSQIQNTECV